MSRTPCRLAGHLRLASEVIGDRANRRNNRQNIWWLKTNTWYIDIRYTYIREHPSRLACLKYKRVVPQPSAWCTTRPQFPLSPPQPLKRLTPRIPLLRLRADARSHNPLARPPAHPLKGVRGGWGPWRRGGGGARLPSAELIRTECARQHSFLESQSGWEVVAQQLRLRQRLRVHHARGGGRRRPPARVAPLAQPLRQRLVASGLAAPGPRTRASVNTRCQGEQRYTREA